MTAMQLPADMAAGGELPRHVAVIMDGNRRWAQRQGKPPLAGHRAGVENVRMAVRLCSDLGVGYLTCYAFSTENWKRSATEVQGLWRLLIEFLASDLPELMARGVRLRVIGDRAGLPLFVRQAVNSAETATSRGRGLSLLLALNYGSRQEIAGAARALCREVAEGRLRPEDVDEHALEAHLSTAGIPDPDLVIRTSGEQRLSNFLLWQVAYSELWVTPACWPEFTRDDFLAALDDYGKRHRRFGGSDAQQ